MKKLAGMPSSKIFVTGGASSGKSGFAENLALELFNKYLNNSNIANGSISSTSGNLNGAVNCPSLHFIATANPFTLDKEMKIKVEEHKKRRSDLFIAHEDFDDLRLEIENIYNSSNSQYCIILVESLTMWLSGIFMEVSAYDLAYEKLTELTACLKDVECSLIVISDLLSFNIVPADRYVREFIRLNGIMEQKLSAISDAAFCIIAGMPLKLK